MAKNSRKTLIFDFDGVIADSFEITVEILKKLCLISWDRSDRELGKKESGYFRTLSSEELFFKMPKWKLFVMVVYARYKLAGAIGKIKPTSGIKSELEKLKDAGYVLGIISSNYDGSIRKFLEVNNMNFFDFIYSSSVLLKKGKRLREVIDRRGLSREEVIFIGDETRDIEAAKKAGVRIVSVGWGFTSEEVLKKYNPDYIIRKPEELSGVIDKIYN